MKASTRYRHRKTGVVYEPERTEGSGNNTYVYTTEPDGTKSRHRLLDLEPTTDPATPVVRPTARHKNAYISYYRPISEPMGGQDDHPADKAIRAWVNLGRPSAQATQAAFMASCTAEETKKAADHRQAARTHDRAQRGLDQGEYGPVIQAHLEAVEHHTGMAEAISGRPTAQEGPTTVNVSNNSRNDKTARDLAGLTLDQMYEHASRELGDTKEALRARYGHLNPGLQRMNLGNRLRAHNEAKPATAPAKTARK